MLNNNLYKSLTKKMIIEIEAWLKKFPANQVGSAIIPTLTIVQQHNHGWLSSALLNDIANYLKVPITAVYEVATFYPKFVLKPMAKHNIKLCTNVPCMLSGSHKIQQYLQEKLGLHVNEFNKDQVFSFQELHCIAACDKAPVIQINDQQMHHATIEKIEQILINLEPQDVEPQHE